MRLAGAQPCWSAAFLHDLAEVARFKAWAASRPTRCGELRTGFENFLKECAPETWSAEHTAAVLNGVARDNELELLAATLTQYPQQLLIAATACLVRDPRC
jgi:hypothetical protein